MKRAFRTGAAINVNQPLLRLFIERILFYYPRSKRERLLPKEGKHQGAGTELHLLLSPRTSGLALWASSVKHRMGRHRVLYNENLVTHNKSMLAKLSYLQRE